MPSRLYTASLRKTALAQAHAAAEGTAFDSRIAPVAGESRDAYALRIRRTDRVVADHLAVGTDD